MVIGNTIINGYWEAIPTCHERKPKWGASSQDIRIYVRDKYIKRKYVRDVNEPHPLTVYKKTGIIPAAKEEKKELQKDVEKEEDRSVKLVKEKPKV